jgi:hypothetical protein
VKALFGGPLEGTAPVRFIYVDEAGTARHEPMTIVVGVLVHADAQWKITAKAILEAHKKVPEKFRPEGYFISHATDIWGSPKYRPEWSREDRMSFLCELMGIPWKLQLALAYAAVTRKETPLLHNPEVNLTKEQTDHVAAFGTCLGLADHYMREQCWPNELATVVAEDLPEMRANLRGIMHSFQRNPPVFGDSPALPITRVVDTVHYAAKKDALILQVADACAFGLRRYFSGQSSGEDFARAISPGKALDQVVPGNALTAGVISSVTRSLKLTPPNPDFKVSYGTIKL